MKQNRWTKKFLVVLALMAAVGGTGMARADDTINFSQFGANGTVLGSPITGLTTNGVGVTLTSPNGSFTVLQEGNDWNGIFPLTAPILFDGDVSGDYGPGTVELSFASPISGLTLAGQADDYGAYTETAVAYSGTTVVDTASASSFNWIDDSNPAHQGIVPFLTVSGVDITSVDFSVTNDSIGLALYGGAGVTPPVPEPGSLLLLGTGLVGLTGALRRKLAR